MTLVDTSVWIEYFRRGPIEHVEELISVGEATVCDAVLLEVLQGFRDETRHRLARRLLLNLEPIESPMQRQVFLEASELYRSARRVGVTIRSSIDCLIAACAIRHDLEVLHADRDFPKLARISPLRERNLLG